MVPHAFDPTPSPEQVACGGLITVLSSQSPSGQKFVPTPSHGAVHRERAATRRKARAPKAALPSLFSERTEERMLALGLAPLDGRAGRRSRARLWFSLAVGATLLSALTAVLVLGICVTNPIGVADAVSTGDLAAIFRVVSTFVMSVVKETVKYL
jgi:hypothetical protein